MVPMDGVRLISAKDRLLPTKTSKKCTLRACSLDQMILGVAIFGKKVRIPPNWVGE